MSANGRGASEVNQAGIAETGSAARVTWRPVAGGMRSLSSKIIAIQVAFLTVALISIGVTLLVSWQLEGGAAAINDAGSLRMRAYRLAFVLADSRGDLAETTRQELIEDLRQFDGVLATLKQGDPARPLLLPDDRGMAAMLAAIEVRWSGLREVARQAIDGKPAVVAKGDVAEFVASINALVSRVEEDLARRTNLLTMFQLGLAGMAVAGAITLVYLAFLVIIQPLQRLREGMESMAGADFNVRLPSGGGDEFGQLAAGFNDMADRLRDLYGSLESRVRDKTRRLAERNTELTSLYDTTAFLAEPQAIEALCQGFLERVAEAMGADAAAIRFNGADAPRLHLFAAHNLPPEFIDDAPCAAAEGCACHRAASTQTTIRWGDVSAPATPVAGCHRHGLPALLAVPVQAQGETIGVLNLFFRQPRELDIHEKHLLETLGQHLGVAVENQRLIAREKEMAVSEERNLLAQELHDSIAQSLAFLNLQVQMLVGALKREDRKAAGTATDEIATGVRECYADVRELLIHFRTRSSGEDISTALKLTLMKFEQQTGIRVTFSESGQAMPVPAEAQVQILHIIQEALSNVRKHAGASAVRVSLHRGAVYTFEVSDDGRGFEADAGASELHVGLKIMQERARRAGAVVAVESGAGRGTRVTLTIPVMTNLVTPSKLAEAA